MQRIYGLVIVALLTAAGCDTDTEDIVTQAECPEGVDYSAGLDLFQTQCSQCHGDDGLGGTGPGIRHELHHSDAELIEVMLNGKESMPPVNISEAEAQSIVDYMRCEQASP